MSSYTEIDAYLESHLDDSLAELSRFVAQPSVGAQNWGMQECAALVADMLNARGFSAEIMPTPGAPVVFGERRGKSDKILLFYCHYDVQPAEPLDLWETPPFEPSLREGKLYGRGVSDDKGHLAARLFAVDALLAKLGELPCHVKLIVEG
ncbi:MAG: M20/M25/M40 family metallo-hydrolase, partial [Chloroflexi bacterium]|nr:M20/M25/M40 family metallo-hydrolase [Chloroflexota bacterium]